MKALFDHAIAIAPRGTTGQDRAAVIPVSDGLIVVLADGAGGTGHGDVAADAVIDAVSRSPGAPSWSALLSALDQDAALLRGGQTTAVVLHLTRHEISGASVGDSGAWVIRGSQIEDVTDGQPRKPLLGAGCHPFELRAAPLRADTLVVASDGLLRYARPHDIARLATGPDLAAAAQSLVELVRLRSGALPDDVAVVLCRQAGG